MHSSGLPIQGTVEWLLRPEVPFEARDGNSATAAAVRRSYSRKISYLPKTQSVSIAALHHVLPRTEEEFDSDYDAPCYNTISEVGSDSQVADCLTKG